MGTREGMRHVKVERQEGSRAAYYAEGGSVICRHYAHCAHCAGSTSAPTSSKFCTASTLPVAVNSCNSVETEAEAEGEEGWVGELLQRCFAHRHQRSWAICTLAIDIVDVIQRAHLLYGEFATAEYSLELRFVYGLGLGILCLRTAR